MNYIIAEMKVNSLSGSFKLEGSGSPSQNLALDSDDKKLIRQWIDNPRFCKWKAYHIASGYATTNNPVEQYHRTVKLVNNRASPTRIEMFNLLDQSRIGYLAEKRSFNPITKVSMKLKAYYNSIRARG
ncbi:LOW QUALITY PROTEIN: hypothetical protein PHMEG_00019516 [Phytophthora megakarya]|uniref:Uncharacterized protein n=1 Tax=Phytophthora megakarya TaxID=4795 RepID=A0A225VTY8_9STRA|nr:LOW QUALITY PROTEIN: hypothetical protein PHMEG_00019516 [Phytophthora megakarya]